MDNSQQSTRTTSQPPRWLEFLTRERQRSSFALLGIGAAFAALGTWVAVKYGQEYASIGVWGWLLALIFMGAGLWQRMRQPPTALSQVHDVRLLDLLIRCRVS